MYLISEYVALVVLILTLGILLFGFCVVLLLISWGIQKAAGQFEKSVAERAVHRMTVGPDPLPGPATHYHFHTFLGRRLASEAPSAITNGPGAGPEPAPHLLQ
jgi:hypothetical protein